MLVCWYRDIPSVYIKIALLIHITDNKPDHSPSHLTPHISHFSSLARTNFKVIPHILITFIMASVTFSKGKILNFSNLLESPDYSDVSLVCDDRTIPAHGAVLSLASDLLRNILITNPGGGHHVLLLCDVNFEELRPLLSFIYTGETKISQDKVKRFLTVSASGILKIISLIL